MATILAMPGISNGCSLICSPSARYWYSQLRETSPFVVWRAIPRQGKLPAQLNWNPKRVADEVLNLWSEQPHGGTEWFLPLNELQFQKENGGPFPGYATLASSLDSLRIELRQRLEPDVKLMFPAWVPGDDLDHSSEWVDRASLWDAICLHAYGSAAEITSRLHAYRDLFGPGVPIFIGEWNANHTGADERETLRQLDVCRRHDPDFLGSAYYIWETRNDGEQDLSVWGNPDRYALFLNPPLTQPQPEPAPVPNYRAMARDAAVTAGISPDLFELQILQESGYRLDVIECRVGSSAGAMGISQIVRRFHPNVDPCDPPAALAYAAGLMKDHLAYWKGSWALALASYNAGRQATIDGLAGNKDGWPFAETVTYVSTILSIPRTDAVKILTGKPTTGGPVTDTAAILAKVIELAKAEFGKPYSGPIVGQPDSYRWGDPGWDCSSFVSGMFDRATNGQIKLTPYTDAAYGQCEQVKQPVPGCVTFYHYPDSSQAATYPHMGIWLSTTEVLDCRYPEGVGIHPHVTPVGPINGRYRITMLPKGLSAVVPPPIVPPTPVPEPTPVPPVPHDDEAGLRTKLGFASHEIVDAVEKELASIEASIGAARAALNALRGLAPV